MNVPETSDRVAETRYLTLLLDEGLELLAAYRRISDPAMRQRVRDLAKSLADEQDGSLGS